MESTAACSDGDIRRMEEELEAAEARVAFRTEAKSACRLPFRLKARYARAKKRLEAAEDLVAAANAEGLRPTSRWARAARRGMMADQRQKVDGLWRRFGEALEALRQRVEREEVAVGE